MRIRNSRLVGDDNRTVPQETTPNQGSRLNGGQPRFLVIHYTSGGTMSGAVSWFKNPAANASAHLVIDHDGSIVQMVDFDTVAWHAGSSRWRGVRGVNSCSIGIEIVNWGKLRHTGSGGFASRVGTPVPSERVILDEHKHAPGRTEPWEVFDESQMMAAVRAAQAIVSEFGIQPWDVVGHDDISPRRKIDPGPAFEIDLFRSLVFGRSEDDWNNALFAVQSPSGLNMRDEPKLSGKLLKNLPDGTAVNLIEPHGLWWLVAEVVDGDDDVTGFVHSNWLTPA